MENNIKKIQLSALTRNPDNPKMTLTQKQKEALRESIKHSGFKGVLVVFPTEDGKYLILDGNNRYDQLLALGEKEVSCLVADDFSKEEAEEFVLSFDQVKGDYDEEMVLEKAKSLIKNGRSLEDLSKLTMINPKQLNIFKLSEDIKDKAKDTPKDKTVKSKTPIVFSLTQEQKQQLDFLTNKSKNKVKKILEVIKEYALDVNDDWLVNLTIKYYYDKYSEFKKEQEE